MEERQRALAVEINEIFDSINTAVGYQLNNRMDIVYRPRGAGATEQVAKTMSQVAMQVCDNNQFRWKETGVFFDGLIQQRGYFELRMSFNDSMVGDIEISTLDPMDVIPDPDAKDYDPDKWKDVIITRWLEIDEIEEMYGTAAAQKVRQRMYGMHERDFGEDADEVARNKFGSEEFGNTYYDAYYTEGGVAHVRIVERQKWVMAMTRVLVTPLGEIRNIESATPEQMAQWRSEGNTVMRRMMKRVRWQAATCDLLIHDAWSPFNHFSVIPFFPFFMRGLTRGMVDNARSPQDVLNKTISKEVQIVSGTANSGWMAEENSLVNMDAEDLEAKGAQSGLVIEYRQGSTKPEKIKPNPIPNGIENLARIGSEKIQKIMGINDALRGEGGKTQSGVSFQSQQYGAQMSLAMPLDSLARTRFLLGSRMLELIQGFYTEQRILRITKSDKVTGRKVTEELKLNWLEGQELINDLTIGEYDVVTSDQPTQITWENSQFNQLMEIEKARPGTIPPQILLRYSSVADRAEIIDEIMSQPRTNPVDEAKAALLQSQAALTMTKKVNENVQALFSALRSSQLLAQVPQLAGLADTIARSAGFVDEDPAPIYPSGLEAVSAGPVPPPPDNTNPITPDHADRGAATGIEAGPQQTTTEGA